MKTKQLFIMFAASAVCLTCLFLMSGCKKSGSESSGEGLPAVTTTAVTNVIDNSATCGGNVTSDGGSSVTMRGVLWAVTPNLTFETAPQRTSDGSGIGTFTSTITSLSKGTTYYVRAYAVNSKGVGYGTEYPFTTTSFGVSVVTDSVFSVTSSSAKCAGTVTVIDQSMTVNMKGVVWGTSENPKASLSTKTQNGSGAGSFTGNISGLTAETTYYVRAYAVTSKDTCYGDQKSFSTEKGGGGGSDYPESLGLECVTINGVVWAPVNCGYDATKYPYGKLYQWGRIYPCEYNAPWTDGGGSHTAEVQLQATTQGPVAANSEKSDEFYKYLSSPYDWLTPPDDLRWNSGTETSPIKTQYDPCPSGWRVPTYTELCAVLGSHTSGNLQDGIGVHYGMKGKWFDGSTVSEPSSGLFLLAASFRNGYNGSAEYRGSRGYYWSSLIYNNHPVCLVFDNNDADMNLGGCAGGFSVRCVQE